MSEVQIKDKVEQIPYKVKDISLADWGRVCLSIISILNQFLDD